MNGTGYKEARPCNSDLAGGRVMATPTEQPTCAFGACSAPAVALLEQTFEGHPEPKRRPICGPHSQLMELLIEILQRKAQLATRAAPAHPPPVPPKRSTCA